MLGYCLHYTLTAYSSLVSSSSLSGMTRGLSPSWLFGRTTSGLGAGLASPSPAASSSSLHLGPCSICHFCWQHIALVALDLIRKVSLPYYSLDPLFLWFPGLLFPIIPILVDVPMDFVPLEIGLLLLGIGLTLLLLLGI